MPHISKRNSLFCSILCFLMVFTAGTAFARSKHQSAKKQPYAVGQKFSGTSAWYGQNAHGNPTTSGKTFDANKLTAAHRDLPFGTRVKVTNKTNKKSTVVEITDRGPSSKRFIIDISRKAAENIGMRAQGVAPVTLEILSLPKSYKKTPGRSL